ncbi:hypothetical protein MJO28_011982 [Puccinia striiformis f. sp. tritici]|uniref:Uncharacterized protein n=1 Tax=Puccinia striiformis f. sp. tritici TaxID=168172 RepID=A0ACC0DZ05_9BASI|nr:hypothetical protein Pst134EA_023172 [Puccinia striiformis f. sp. tritici]KAH9455719.1 hypothetical protein Pst134EA_023172 [Puccinia striiformis f. sp. tritici]KAI7941955.1 hypothetical protein MJO28_011982 [Puccinia striiformis f. sp. tritici]KAI7946124.1 hypothetical protein MJO29_012512 [Puccinia striiformis f. sp. tritici]
MWRPGKWVYIEEEDEESNENNNDDNNNNNNNNEGSVDPPSPPWKLGQVPEETAIFKDGRRMSRRFNQQQQQQQPTTKNQTPPPQATTTMPKRTRRKSTGQVSNQNTTQAKSRRKSHAQPTPTAEEEDELEDNKDQETHQNQNQNPPDSTPITDTSPNFDQSQSDSTRLTQDQLNPKSNAATGEAPILDFNSVTEAHSAGPPTPPAIEFSRGTTFQDRRASAPPVPPPSVSTDLLHLPPPLKKFKPWEALKGFHTDGTDVAGDLRLIQEGNQKKLDNHNARNHKKTAVQSAGKQAPIPGNSRGTEQSDSKREQEEDELSSLSDLTELSSSLSDLSDEEEPNQEHRRRRQRRSSSSSSLIYSEVELEDDCLPEALVRTVRRPSRPSVSTTIENSSAAPVTSDQKSLNEFIKWKKRNSVVLHHRERKVALRKSINDHPPSTNNTSTTIDPENWEPPSYIKIKSNTYPFRKPELSEFPPAICNCTDGGCGEKCLNRAMFYLCDPKQCQLGQSCLNVPFNQRKDLIDESSTKLGKGLKVFYTGPIKGWGLKTEIKLKKDSFVIDYRGEIISRDLCYKRVLNEYHGFKHFYLMDYDGSDVIDAGIKGNCSRFINHSCVPNLRVERFKLSGLEEYQFGIFTTRDIEIGEELSYDYGWRNFSDIAPTSNIRTSILSKPSTSTSTTEGQEEQPRTLRRSTISNRTSVVLVSATAPTVQRCYCGSKGCKGFLGAKKLTPIHPPSSISTATATATAKTSSGILEKGKSRPTTLRKSVNSGSATTTATTTSSGKRKKKS